MPGSSRVPISLRTFTSKNRARAAPYLVLNLDLVKNILFIWFLLKYLRRGIRQIRGRGILGTCSDGYRAFQRWSYGLILSLPWYKAKIKLELEQTMKKLEDKFVPKGPGVTRYLALPISGWTDEQVKAELQKLSEMHHAEWEKGRVSGAVYHGGNDLLDLQAEAYRMFSVSNPLHPDAFPGVRKMEAEIVAMVLDMYHAPSSAGGTTTSGGTESILMACLAARNKAYHERGVTEPEMVVPTTIHAAFDKAGFYFGIKVHHIAIDPVTLKVDTKALDRMINYNTILIAGSAPNFPHGIIDDIAALSRIALKRRVPLHVDACLGSFLIPFLEKAGFPTEPFDFRLKGVTSISCDTHKYGFAPKGNSVIMYRTKKFRQNQYFVTATWPGGVYASPSIAGSRAGSLIAGTWASLMRQGESGYISSCASIVAIRQAIESAIRDTLAPDLYVLGEPKVSVVAFASRSLNVYEVADAMSEMGWHLNALQDPPAVHIACTRLTGEAVQAFVTDLTEAVKMVKLKGGEGEKGGSTGKGKGSAKKGDTAALYGVAGSLPNKSVVEDIAVGFIDTLYKA
ncbi:PLP-dependent transferase [Terfezia boudieri ATCC MYA-4762]|uniref:sphinganine-1-phosphate aldolase n=1 Tax=Terfezia boudieri ATCC MYA-4762 TaxID=1051890 RepID=A0A3N4LYR7_9PEZI|nr:PLP-dependent transferase [Terfezia boudieri ATCC MYA-4762]